MGNLAFFDLIPPILKPTFKERRAVGIKRHSF